MTLIDAKYQEQLNRMHASGKFNNGAKAYRIVEKFIKEYKPTSVLDFGCGKGSLIAGINASHPEIFTQGYDPGNPDLEHLMLLSAPTPWNTLNLRILTRLCVPLAVKLNAVGFLESPAILPRKNCPTDAMLT